MEADQGQDSRQGHLGVLMGSYGKRDHMCEPGCFFRPIGVTIAGRDILVSPDTSISLDVQEGMLWVREGENSIVSSF